ncbi:MAG: RNA polymerase sigma factor [Planctomycetota bacterium]
MSQGRTTTEIALSPVPVRAADRDRGASVPAKQRERAADRELLERILNNDTQAWDALVERYAGLLHAVARRTCAAYGYPAQEQDVEDAVAEVWRNLLEKERELVYTCASRGCLAQTLHVLARHRAIDLMRKRRLRTVEYQEHHAPSTAPDVDAVFAERAAEVRAAVDRLPDRERTLVRLFFLQGRKYREIEELTGIPMNSIGPTLNRALQRIRSRLGLD